MDLIRNLEEFLEKHDFETKHQRREEIQLEEKRLGFLRRDRVTFLLEINLKALNFRQNLSAWAKKQTIASSTTVNFKNNCSYFKSKFSMHQPVEVCPDQMPKSNQPRDVDIFQNEVWLL